MPFGGHFGDCSDYHGVVVALNVDPPQLIGAWLTRAAKGGIWAPAGLSEADGSLYFSTGNTEGARNWGDGEGVFRVGPDLPPIDPTCFRPVGLEAARRRRSGSWRGHAVAPDAAWRSKPLLLALGKDGKAYLLDRTNLGGIGNAWRSTKRRAAPSSPPRRSIRWETP